LETGKGVCYDFSALVAALGRASGLQVKMIKGNFIGHTATNCTPGMKYISPKKADG